MGNKASFSPALPGSPGILLPARQVPARSPLQEARAGVAQHIQARIERRAAAAGLSRAFQRIDTLDQAAVFGPRTEAATVKAMLTGNALNPTARAATLRFGDAFDAYKNADYASRPTASKALSEARHTLAATLASPPSAERASELAAPSRSAREARKNFAEKFRAITEVEAAWKRGDYVSEARELNTWNDFSGARNRLYSMDPAVYRELEKLEGGFRIDPTARGVVEFVRRLDGSK